MLEANKKQVPIKSYSLKIRFDSVNQILKNKEKIAKTCNINKLTRITDQKILCVYIHVYRIIKNEDLARAILYVMLIIENIFRSLSNVKSSGSAHILLGKRSGKNLEMFLLRDR